MGLCTRYDGNIKANESCLRSLDRILWIPVCPEQLGGLPTPREAADIQGGDGHDVLAGRARVITKGGVDVTSQFVQGAKQVLIIASAQPIAGVKLKSRSPSCAVCGRIGVTAALLQQHGFTLSEY